VSAGTEVGKAAKALMNAGKLVNDDVVFGILHDAIRQPRCANGFILDGFPRTTVQANMLDKLLKDEKMKLNSVVEFKVPDEKLVARITGRLLHKPSGRTYHKLFNPPKQAGKDDVTGEPLIQRSDDNEAALVKRLSEYHSKTMPIVQHYQKQGLYAALNADAPLDTVWRDLKNIVSADH
jgi:adenylate kinase